MVARKAPALCMECHARPKLARRQRCADCYLRHQPADVQTAACAARRAMVPDELAPERVPRSMWPPGQRWCYGCRSFRDLLDVTPGASRCKACTSGAAHLAHIAREYGLAPEDYAELIRRQDGRCAICRARPNSERLAVDHDHATGLVRGLLCSRCNHDLLGAAHDSTTLLESALAYLTEPPTTGRWVPPKAMVRRPANPFGDGQPIGGVPRSLNADDAYRLSGSRGAEVIYVRRDALESPF